MNNLILIVCLVSALYFLLRQRVDLLLLSFGSLILYHHQLILGKFWVPPYQFEVEIQSSKVFCVVISVLLTVTIIYDRLTRHLPVSLPGKPKQFQCQALILLAVSYIFSCYSLYKGFEGPWFAKHEFSGRLAYHFVTYFPAAMVACAAVYYRSYGLLLASSLPLLFYVVAGFRAAFVVAFVTCVVMHFRDRPIFSRQIIIAGSVVVLCFVLLSGVKVYSNGFNPERFASYVDYAFWAMFSAEWGQVSLNLQLGTQYDWSRIHSLVDVLLSSIPLVSDSLDLVADEQRFSRLIYLYNNPGFSYGLGSNIWAEFFQFGGFIGVFMFSFLLYGFIAFSCFTIIKNGYFISPFLIYFFGYLSFYIHRSDLTIAFAFLKNSLMLILLIFCVLFAVNLLAKTWKKQEQLMF